MDNDKGSSVRQPHVECSEVELGLSSAVVCKPQWTSLCWEDNGGCGALQQLVEPGLTKPSRLLLLEEDRNGPLHSGGATEESPSEGGMKLALSPTSLLNTRYK